MERGLYLRRVVPEAPPGVWPAERGRRLGYVPSPPLAGNQAEPMWRRLSAAAATAASTTAATAAAAATADPRGERGAGAERHTAARRDVDRLPGARVAALARLRLRHSPAPEAGETHALLLRQRLADGVDDGVDGLGGLRLGHARALGDSRGKLALANHANLLPLSSAGPKLGPARRRRPRADPLEADFSRPGLASLPYIL